MTVTVSESPSKMDKNIKPRANKTFFEVCKFLCIEMLTTYNSWIIFNMF